MGSRVMQNERWSSNLQESREFKYSPARAICGLRYRRVYRIRAIPYTLIGTVIKA